MNMTAKQRIVTAILFFGLIGAGCQSQNGPGTVVPSVIPETEEFANLATTAPADPSPEASLPPTKTPESMFSGEEAVQSTPGITTTDTITQTSECAQLTWIEDVTVPDGTVLEPGEIFLKIWRVQNSGTCDWGLGYEIAYDRGEQLDGPDITLAHFYAVEGRIGDDFASEAWLGEMDVVGAGETVDIPLLLRAPEVAGEYQSVWRLGDENGIGIDFLWIEIVVEQDLASPGSWDGIWYHSDPGTSEIAEGETLVVDQSDTDILGYFYAIDGRTIVIEGLVTEDEQIVEGIFHSPGQPGIEFAWRQAGSNFQGSYVFGQFGDAAWCGSRDEFTFPNPCGLE